MSIWTSSAKRAMSSGECWAHWSGGDEGMSVGTAEERGEGECRQILGRLCGKNGLGCRRAEKCFGYRSHDFELY
jgi:hypothetical protein